MRPARPFSTSHSTWTSSTPTTHRVSARPCAAGSPTARRISRWRPWPSRSSSIRWTSWRSTRSSTARTRRDSSPSSSSPRRSALASSDAVELEVREGDIAGVEADAIANAANDALWMGAGVAGALKRAGGDEIEQEAMAQGPIPVGSAVATTAGALRARYVIHGAVMGQDLRTNAELVRTTTRACLALADELGCESLALPAFGTGVGGFPLDECAQLMV